MEPPETVQMQEFVESVIELAFTDSRGLIAAIVIIPIIFAVLKRIRKAGV